MTSTDGEARTMETDASPGDAPGGVADASSAPTEEGKGERASRSRWLLARSWWLITRAGAAAVVAVIALVLLLEVLMAANERLFGEETDLSLRNDYDAGLASSALVLPGPSIAVEEEPDPADVDAWRDWLVRRHAPVVVQLLGAHPEWDLPVSMLFDGNDDPRDNRVNAEARYPEHATLYGELTATTADSWYLTYTMYRIRDYDHPTRELIWPSTGHDGDNEGLHLRIDRNTREVVAAETWYHNRFVLCNRTGISTGTDPVLGRLHLEGTHPIVYATDRGHGVRCAQMADTADLYRAKVLRPALGRAPTPLVPDHEPDDAVVYALEDFDRWHELAREDRFSDDPTMFVGQVNLVRRRPVDGVMIEPIDAPGYIAAQDEAAIEHISRPKPMWAWDDLWDGIPAGAWYLLPSYSFASRGGVDLSHSYEYNAPVERILDLTAHELAQVAEFSSAVVDQAERARVKWEEELWERALEPLERRDYWAATTVMVARVAGTLKRQFSRYVTRVFTRLG